MCVHICLCTYNRKDEFDAANHKSVNFESCSLECKNLESVVVKKFL